MHAIVVDYDDGKMRSFKDQLESLGYQVQLIHSGCFGTIGQLALRIMSQIVELKKNVVLVMSRNFTNQPEEGKAYVRRRWSELEALQLLECLNALQKPNIEVQTCVHHAEKIPEEAFPAGWSTETLITPTELGIIQ